ncbi:hypothetical protein BGX29_008440 [Mortierella sp. GBA35]|nr:hypothetical protein BGX29_008440 [Mortierella sp. GBA35]
MHFTSTFTSTFVVALLTILSLSTSTLSTVSAQPQPINTIACYQCLEKAAVALVPSCAGLVSSPLSAIAINPLSLTDNQKSCYCGIGKASASWAKTCENPETCDSATATDYIQSFAFLKSTVCLASDIGNSIFGSGASLSAPSSMKVVTGLTVAAAGALTVFL